MALISLYMTRYGTFDKQRHNSNMPIVTLIPITESNCDLAISLSVHPHQADYIPTVAESLLKAIVKPGGLNYDPYAIHSEDGTMVGFLSHLYEEGGDPGKAYLSGFFIAKEYQGMGYGRAALAAFIAMVREKQPRARDMRLAVHPDNAVAGALYASFGFVPTGLVLDGEDVLKLDIQQ
jgi:diamine N-acetyltransferase